MGIKSRLESLEQRARLYQDTPPLDALSRSLYEADEELRALDEQGIEEYAARLETTSDIIRAMIQDAKKSKRNIFRRRF